MDTPKPERRWPPWVETWVLPYVEDFALWPVLVAMLGHVLVILVPVELAVARTAHPAALLALSILFVLTFEVLRMEWRAIGRPGALWVVVLGMWAVSLPCAWYANELGIL